VVDNGGAWGSEVQIELGGGSTDRWSLRPLEVRNGNETKHRLADVALLPAWETIQGCSVLHIAFGQQSDEIPRGLDRRRWIVAMGRPVSNPSHAILRQPTVTMSLPATGAVALHNEVGWHATRPLDDQATEQQFVADGRGGCGTAGHGVSGLESRMR
jgi:hypothetical protein